MINEVARLISAALVLGVSLGAHLAAAQAHQDLTVSADGLTASVEFSRNTPCTGYTIDWSDGSERVIEEQRAACIQVIDTVTVTHTYKTAGTYEVAVTVRDETVTEEVTVPQETTMFDLSDVASITSEYVDPEPMMADEEYYIHTITLNDGTEVVVEVAAFTMLEMRNQEFRAAGYTGDVEKLLARTDISSEEDQVPPPSSPAEPEWHIRLQLVEVLEELVQRLQQLRARQTQ